MGHSRKKTRHKGGNTITGTCKNKMIQKARFGYEFQFHSEAKLKLEKMGVSTHEHHHARSCIFRYLNAILHLDDAIERKDYKEGYNNAVEAMRKAIYFDFCLNLTRVVGDSSLELIDLREFELEDSYQHLCFAQPDIY
ncbi:glutamate-rich protein grpB [Striga asiatica]|uniref:Glutamate-rich protein grpB n=1 Tax=Striga asiatica TaxID=4170 RepID=A0A5A7QXZ2_STRAF|nr:glutamate-rich protein grpB [Striga asiatica]